LGLTGFEHTLEHLTKILTSRWRKSLYHMNGKPYSKHKYFLFLV